MKFYLTIRKPKYLSTESGAPICNAINSITKISYIMYVTREIIYNNGFMTDYLNAIEDNFRKYPDLGISTIQVIALILLYMTFIVAVTYSTHSGDGSNNAVHDVHCCCVLLKNIYCHSLSMQYKVICLQNVYKINLYF